MTSSIQTKQWLTVEEIAVYLSVKPDTVYKWLERKDMPAHKVGRLWRFCTAEIDEWIRSGEASKISTLKKAGESKSKGGAND